MPTLPTTGNTGFSKHTEYEFNLPQWSRCRDAADGQQTIHLRREVYLPKLSTMDESEYEMYRRRALFFNATSRTVTGLGGAVMRKPTLIEYPTGQADALETIGVGNESVRDLIARTVHQQLLVGRVGHLVDAETDANIVDPEPYIAEYATEQVWNWARELIN